MTLFKCIINPSPIGEITIIWRKKPQFQIEEIILSNPEKTSSQITKEKYEMEESLTLNKKSKQLNNVLREIDNYFKERNYKFSLDYLNLDKLKPFQRAVLEAEFNTKKGTVNTYKDIAKAVELYELAATGGSQSAKQKADILKEKRLDFYLEGYRIITAKTSVTKDEAFTAFRSFAIATAMGEGRAPRYLAMCYAYGFGTEKDRQGAYFWYKHAAECGDKEAYIPLGLCYANGFGIAFSYKDAIKYLKLAKGAGIPGADAELEKLYSRKIRKMVRQLYSTSMRLIYQKKFTEAVGLLSSFESLGYPKALYTLGCLYEFGRGVKKSDRAYADKYYELAYAGHPLYGNFADPSSEYKLIVLKMIR
jgi:methylated-DNA-[protein]-cysteine S-methyltransferase